MAATPRSSATTKGGITHGSGVGTTLVSSGSAAGASTAGASPTARAVSTGATSSVVVTPQDDVRWM